MTLMNKHHQGFTLLEVIIALAIFATVAIAITQILASGVETTISVENESRAYIFAQSKMDEVLLLSDINTADKSGVIGDGSFHYQLNISPQQSVHEVNGFAMYHVLLTLSWGTEPDQSIEIEAIKTQLQ